MKRKIGEIFEYNGEWYQCIKDTEDISCIDCCFYNGGCKLCTDEDMGACVKEYRSDAKSICFKKLEKVGEPTMLDGKLVQKILTTDEYSCNGCCFEYSECDKACNDLCCKDEIYVEIKQIKEDMEEKNNGNTPLNVLTDKYVNGDICYDDFEKEVKALYSCKEGIKPTLKEFDLEAAKSGKPVCTRDGRKARVICFDKQEGFPIIALVETKVNDRVSEEVALFNINGRAVSDDIDSKLDLMMSTEKKEGWVNVYYDNDASSHRGCRYIYDTKEQAIKEAGSNYITTIKINWEE